MPDKPVDPREVATIKVDPEPEIFVKRPKESIVAFYKRGARQGFRRQCHNCQAVRPIGAVRCGECGSYEFRWTKGEPYGMDKDELPKTQRPKPTPNSENYEFKPVQEEPKAEGTATSVPSTAGAAEAKEDKAAGKDPAIKNSEVDDYGASDKAKSQTTKEKPSASSSSRSPRKRSTRSRSKKS